MKSNAN